MPTNRFQFSDDFVLNNGNVGINSATPQTKLDVVGVVRGDNLKVTGVSTFTTYEGFLNSNQNIVENTTISGGGISGSLSGEIIVGTGITVTVASGTTSSQGNIDSLKVYNTFTVPVGGTADRPPKPTPGQLFFNRDFATMEFWDGDRWRQVDNTTQRGRGAFGGGDTPTRVSTIDYINISSTGNAVNFGNLTQSRSDLASGVCASSIRGIFAQGSNGPSFNIIDYITIASEGNAIDFGDSTQITASTASCSSSTRGLFAGATNTIDYITIATIGNALDFGDLSQTRSIFSACSSSTRGVFGGGASPTFVSTIDFVTIASTGNAVKFGDLSQSVRAVASCSSSTRGLFAGGNTSPGVYPALIDFITISSTGNAVKFGDLTAGIWFAGSCSSNIRGVFGGGTNGGSGVTNIISYVTISTQGNAQDFGDLTQARNAPQGTSDSHGGLGGF